ncbi:type II toxin-antitoxin system prevent-host-death family antitoxin [Haloactinomyces albus]|uniref:Antitoxin n=1 Tax=Haloactinomyces albus TaxID=1352928 RepID=A0AAE3ZGT3_9ACTN|nr:type II toxin-antitoxin system prevent-host-death family antitoxin [Haloactinomyces albus]MDR7304592.1 prevent-host-death family protein [Haloactinomyces albus]
MSVEMPVSSARTDIGPVTDRAEYTGEITYLTKHGRRAAAVVSAQAAQLLEELEDLADLETARERLATIGSREGVYDQLRRRLGG